MKKAIRKLTGAEISWILYDVGNSAFVLVMVTAIMPIFFKDWAAKGMADATATANWGFANAAASLLLAISAPVLGTISDYKGVKMKMFTLFLGIGLMFTGGLIFVGEGMWLFCLALFVMARVGWGGANLFYDAAIVDVIPVEKRSVDKKSTINEDGNFLVGESHFNDTSMGGPNTEFYDRQMDRISSLGYAWGYIGSVIPFLIIIAMIMGAETGMEPGAVSGSDGGSAQGALTSSVESSLPIFQTKTGFAVVLIWWALFSLPILFKVKQNNYIASSTTPISDSFKRLGKTFNEIKTKHQKVFLFLVAYFFYIDGVGTVISMSGAYGRDLGFSVPLLIGVILFIQVVAFPFALLFGRLAVIFSARKMLMAGIVVYCLITCIAFALPYIENSDFKIGLFWLIAFLVASSMGGLQALSRSYFASLIPPEKSGEFFGFYNVFGKFAAISGPFLMGSVGRITGETKWGVLSLLVLFTIGGILLAINPGRGKEIKQS